MKEKEEIEERAALRSVDPDRLLEGEDPTTKYIEDAAHWITVYSELVLFKERLVDSANESMRAMTEAHAREEVGKTDLLVLAAERDRLKRRLDYWKERQRELSTRSRKS
ncbi:MAG: hypothetical protein ABI838_09680 [Chloroflexota bacterium]